MGTGTSCFITRPYYTLVCTQIYLSCGYLLKILHMSCHLHKAYYDNTSCRIWWECNTTSLGSSFYSPGMSLSNNALTALYSGADRVSGWSNVDIHCRMAPQVTEYFEVLSIAHGLVWGFWKVKVTAGYLFHPDIINMRKSAAWSLGGRSNYTHLGRTHP